MGDEIQQECMRGDGRCEHVVYEGEIDGAKDEWTQASFIERLPTRPKAI